MSRIPRATYVSAALLLTAAATAIAQDAPPAQPRAPEAKSPAPAPGGKLTPERIREIWPAGLERLAGRYVFVQVASPGGLWERQPEARGGPSSRQVSINEVPAAFRDLLRSAEVVISDLKLPTWVEAAERESPTKRGMLRFYSETAEGRVSVKNLPGIGGISGGTYSGPALFQLEHQVHSNPSVSGILNQRQQQEATWGAATLDFAELSAATVPKDKDGEDEGEVIIGNCRTLRSGIELFVFVEWTHKEKGEERNYHGSVRLIRDRRPPAPVARQIPRNSRAIMK